MSLVISASYDRQVRFWDPSTARTIRNLVFTDSQINALSVSPDRCRLAVAGHGVIRYYDVASTAQYPPPVASFECSTAGNFTAIGHVLLQHGSGSGVLYACSEDGVLRILDPRQTAMTVVREFTTGVAITCAALSTRGNLLFTGSQIGKLSLWHCDSIIPGSGSNLSAPLSSKPLQELSFVSDHTAIRSIAVSPLGNWVAVATNAGKVHTLAFSEQVAQQSDAETVLARPNIVVNASRDQLSVSDNGAPNGSDNPSLVSARQDDPTPLQNVSVDEPPPVSTPSVSTKPAISVLTPELQKLMMECVHTTTCHYKYILKVVISPDGKLMATCSADYTVGLWSVPTPFARPNELGGVSTSPAASPKREPTDPGSPSTLATTAPVPALSPKGSLSNMSSQQQFKDPSPSSPGIQQPQATTTAAKLSNPYEMKSTTKLQGHTRWVWDCAFSPCSSALATVSSDNQVRLWTGLQTDKPKCEIFMGHTKPVVCVLFDYERPRADT